MIKQFSAMILACGICAGTALAADPVKQSSTPVTVQIQTPTQTPSDPRIRHYFYNENSVYRLDLYLKAVTAIQFSDTEEIQSILIGDSASWEVVKLKSGNVVSIKPTVASATTNMTIYTDRRVYTFELHSAGETAAGSPDIFRTVFTYPPDPKPKAAVDESVSSGPVSADYLVSGEASFKPKWVQDNGRQTTFFLPKNSPRPAIFKVGSKGTEELVNSRSRGSQVIVDGTASFWVLRIGDKSVCIGRERSVRKSGFPVRGSGDRRRG